MFLLDVAYLQWVMRWRSALGTENEKHPPSELRLSVNQLFGTARKSKEKGKKI